jgi:hypothetical protein
MGDPGGGGGVVCADGLGVIGKILAEGDENKTLE